MYHIHRKFKTSVNFFKVFSTPCNLNFAFSRGKIYRLNFHFLGNQVREHIFFTCFQHFRNDIFLKFLLLGGFIMNKYQNFENIRLDCYVISQQNIALYNYKYKLSSSKKIIIQIKTFLRHLLKDDESVWIVSNKTFCSLLTI